MSAKKIIGCVSLILSTSIYANINSSQSNIGKSSYDLSDDSGYSSTSDRGKPYYAYKKSSPRARHSYKETVTEYSMPKPCCGVVYLGAYGGYGAINGAYQSDGQFTQGRVAMGGLYVGDNFMVGAELGVQSGNTMHLQIPDDYLVETGGEPWLATLKPLADLLLTVKFRVISNQQVFLNIKAGGAYRQLQLNNTSTNYWISRVSPEGQLGLSFNVTKNAMLTLFYQGIYSTSDVGASVDSFGNGTISYIPTQQAGFIGIEYSL